MLAAFDFLGGLSAALLVLAGASAYTMDPHFHALCGLAAGLAVLAMHTLMFLFFIGTARAVKDAVAARGLSRDLLGDDKRLMALVMAPGSFGPLSIVVASFLGAAPTPAIALAVHPGLMALAVATNVWAYRRERSTIKLKHAHLARARAALAQIERGLAPPAAPPEPPPPRAWAAGAVVLLCGLSAAGYYPYRRFVMGDVHWPSPLWIAAGLPLVAAGAALMVMGRHRP
ncbi:MAG: hypothetical protein U1E76_01085 [Planctomycetota bacterium]